MSLDDTTTLLTGRDSFTADRARGCIVGLAVGDALGYPHEFRTREQVQREIGPEGITTFLAHKDPRFSRPVILGPDHPPGTFTDDTQMTLALADAIFAAGTSASVDDLMRATADAFVKWANADDNDRAPGETCMTGCRNLERGVHWSVAGVSESKGCGSVMRVAPLGLISDDLEEVAELARAQSLLTHGHHAALEACAAMAMAVSLASVGTDPAKIHEVVAGACCRRSSDFARVWNRIPAALARDPGDVIVEVESADDALGLGWVGEEAAAVAMYCFWKYPDDFRSAVIAGANTDGDSDSTACLAGALAGARLGWTAIPEDLREGVEDADRLKQVGDRLHAHLLERRKLGHFDAQSAPV